MQGRVFAWIDRMLSAPAPSAHLADWGPPKDAVGRSALTNLLQSNSSSNSELAAVFVDRAYSADQQVAAGYFQVRCGWLAGPLAGCLGRQGVGNDGREHCLLLTPHCLLLASHCRRC